MPIPEETARMLSRVNYDLVMHHQSQRSTLSGIILTVSAALMALITFDQKIDPTDRLPSALILFLSIYGGLTAIKHHERVKHYLTRAEAFRDSLSPEIAELVSDADCRAHTSWFWRFIRSGFKMWYLWIVLYGFVAVTSTYLLLKTYPESPPSTPQQTANSQPVPPASKPENKPATPKP